MKNNQYKTPVVLWRSQWVELGKTEVYDKKGNATEVPNLMLVGIVNKDHHLITRKNNVS